MLVIVGGFALARFIVVPAISPRPADLGVGSAGDLRSCPSTPNCVHTQADPTDEDHFIPPIALDADTSPAQAQARIRQIVASMDRSTIITDDDRYLHVEFRSLLWGFIDDTEFYFADDAIHFRSGARLGRSDIGMNRQRMETIRERFGAQ
ncbi:MAG: DUF1499 domain-containing protein [Anaerolineaceae bacterium]|nr:MAG: DUF1499 domain-containing protein [Anaerolineaceae bacterium]